MRLQQYLARSGVTSRRKAEDLIRSGRVSINEQVAQIGAVVGAKDVVRLDGERVRLPQKTVVIALHKPKGYTTTHEDEHAEKLVYQLVPEHPGLHSVGRLDKDTEGLLLLTNDGNLTQLLTHPSNQVPKLYRAWSKKGRLSVADCQQLTEGLLLSDGFAKALEAVPTKEGAKLVLTEGRKREVRRMLGKIGHPVEKLLRLAVGVIELGNLESGAYRYLDSEEIALLEGNAIPPKLRKPAPAAKQRRKPAEPSANPRASKPSGSDNSRGRKPRVTVPVSKDTLSETTKVRIAKAMQQLKTEDQAEIPQGASNRRGRNKSRSGQAVSAKPTLPRAERPARAEDPPTSSRKSYERSAKPSGDARSVRRAKPSGPAEAARKPSRTADKLEGRSRPATKESRQAQAKTKPTDAKPFKRSSRSSDEKQATPRPAKSTAGGKPPQAKQTSVKSGDERIRGGQRQGSNQRSANKGTNPRARRTNQK